MPDVPEWINILKSDYNVGNDKHVPKNRVNTSHYEVTKTSPLLS